MKYGHNYEILRGQVREYVEMLFSMFWTPKLVYHNLGHTQRVVVRALEISGDFNLTGEELFILETAAWFHDTGQLIADPQGHEERSADFMEVFFRGKGLPTEITDKIEECILATTMPQQPTGQLEMILCDADTYNLGTEEFQLTDALIKRELMVRGSMPVGNWDMNTLALLLNHRFFTPYCKELLNYGKTTNIRMIRERIRAGN